MWENHLYVCFFFFSSRRRHTRCSRDWSSDVCSSDLQIVLVLENKSASRGRGRARGRGRRGDSWKATGKVCFKIRPPEERNIDTQRRMRRAGCRVAVRKPCPHCPTSED